jgi:hypothetical protein
MTDNAKTAATPEPICGNCHKRVTECEGTVACQDYWHARLYEVEDD